MRVKLNLRLIVCKVFFPPVYLSGVSMTVSKEVNWETTRLLTLGSSSLCLTKEFIRASTCNRVGDLLGAMGIGGR